MNIQKKPINKYFIAILIFIVLVGAMIGIFWDRQQKRELAEHRLDAQADVLVANPVAFTTKVSFKNIVEKFSASVVSIQVETNSLFAAQPQLAVTPGINQTQPLPFQPQQGLPQAGNSLVQQAPVPGEAQMPGVLQQNPQNQAGNMFQNQGKGGSGIIVHKKGYVLTNHHVIDGGTRFTVTLSAGVISKTYRAKLVAEAPQFDLAILQIITQGVELFYPAALGDSKLLSMGDEILCIGSPYGLAQTVTFGIVSNTNRSIVVNNISFTNLIQTDACINPGSSGGPLINMNAEVIGVNTAIYSPNTSFTGIGFAIPVNVALQAFPDFIESTVTPLPMQNNVQAQAQPVIGNFNRILNIPGIGGFGNQFNGASFICPGCSMQIPQCGMHPNSRLLCPNCGQCLQQGFFDQGLANPLLNQSPVQPNQINAAPQAAVQPVAIVNPGRVWLGIKAMDIDRNNAAQLNSPVSWGVFVTEVFGYSPAFAGGILRGDIIYRLNNRLVKSQKMLSDMLINKKEDALVKVTVFRQNQQIDCNVTLRMRPPETALNAQAIAFQCPANPVGMGQGGCILPVAAAANTPAAAPVDPADLPPAGLQGSVAGAEVGAGEIEALGMGVEELTPDMAFAYGIDKDVKGLIIPEVAGLAEAAGLIPGDVILEVNNVPVTTMVAYIKEMNKADTKKGILLTILRQKNKFYLTLKK